jgi:lysophospholipase L1-like esterase
VAHDAPAIANVKLPGAGTTVVHGPEYAYFRDVQVVPWEIALPTQYGRNVAFLGDSFTKNGQYPYTDQLILGCQTQFYGDTSTRATNNHMNGGVLPQLQGRLALGGVHVSGGRIRWYGRGGAGVTGGTSTLTNMVDRLLTGVDGATETMGDHGRYENRPDVVCIMIGANDYAETDASAWKAAYAAEIDRLIAAGAQHIIINTLGPYTMEPEINTAPYRANVDAMNVKVMELAASYPQIGVADLFGRLGGHDNYDPLDFGLSTPGDADRHLSTYGHRKAGDAYASVILGRV